MAKRNILETFQDASTKQLVTRIVGEYLKPYIPTLFFGLFCMMLTAAATALLAHQMEPVIDKVFDSLDRSMIWVVAAQVFCIFVLKGASSYGATLAMTRMGEGIVSDMRKQMFAHAIKADLSFFQNTPTGELLSRFTTDVTMLHHVVSSIITRMVRDFFSLIFLVIVMFQKDWFLSLCIFIIFPLAYYPVLKLGQKMRRSSGNVQQHLAKFTTQISQIFYGIRVIKSYSTEDLEIGHVNKMIDTIYQYIIKMTRNRAATNPIMEVFAGFAIVSVIAYGGFSVMEGLQTKGSFFSFITAVLLAYEPLKRIANLNADLQEKLAAAIRVFQVIDIQSDIYTKSPAQPLTHVKGTIQFKDVCFGYEEDHPVLHSISLTIPAGKTAALVGPSGGGKSTILNMIPRFYDTTQGVIEIDGHNIKEVDLKSLRDHIALVSQEVFLFDDTIARNIAYGCASAREEDIISAAQAAAAHEFIEKLPQGYETVIGEQGIRLSGGQRQRIAIARAMLKNAPILLLDEATSALDTTSEKKIQDALENLLKDRTTLLIAHRLSTVQHADIIFVISQGQVLAQGQHQELLSTCELYASLCKTTLQERPRA